jgi:hypothetical protein
MGGGDPAQLNVGTVPQRGGDLDGGHGGAAWNAVPALFEREGNAHGGPWWHVTAS